MILPNRPNISDSEMDKIVAYFFPSVVPDVLFLFVRGYFSQTFSPIGNNIGVWDDAAAIYAGGNRVQTFNANTDPRKVNSNLAMLDPGVYQFAKGRHKNRIDGFRAFPEGVRLPCHRQTSGGSWIKSFCSFINIHDGGTLDTYSEGCLTLPNWTGQKQLDEFVRVGYGLMDQYKLKTATTLLIDERSFNEALK
jgi:hypothetical protein